jgi:anti-sigma regulatory factor (Ser/Thr protein kinase)
VDLTDGEPDPGRPLAAFTVTSEPGNERLVMARVTEAVADIEMAPARLERLKTAVAEATMNAMEHGNEYRADRPVSIRVLGSADSVRVQVSDLGGVTKLPEAEVPDLEAKLAGRQKPRGWGLFLIQNSKLLTWNDRNGPIRWMRLHFQAKTCSTKRIPMSDKGWTNPIKITFCTCPYIVL